MTMVALNADRTKVVETGSLEARWMVDADEAETYIEDAKKHPKMQALMQCQEAERLEDEQLSAERRAADQAYWARKQGA